MKVLLNERELPCKCDSNSPGGKLEGRVVCEAFRILSKRVKSQQEKPQDR